MLIGIIREVSESLPHCELTFLDRCQIDVVKARAQHAAFRDALSKLNIRLILLEAQNHLPDAVFVEDCALVVDELAVIAKMGSSSRKPEIETLTSKLAQFRPLKFLNDPATLDGGDVLRIGRDLYVGLSGRTNEEAVMQLERILARYGYRVIAVPLTGCLHLKTAVTYIGDNSVLVNPKWVDTSCFQSRRIISVSLDEPWSANALCIQDQVLFPASFPKTQNLLENAGFKVHCLDIGEFQKAEAGLTCLSIIFELESDTHSFIS